MRQRDQSRPRVLRVASVFHVPAAGLAGRGRRFDPVGGMQNHTYQLTRRLDERGVTQSVVTARRPGSPRWERIGQSSEVFRVGVPIPWFRQLYAAPAARMAAVVGTRVDVVHAHLGEDLAVLPLANAAARRHGLPWVVTVHCSLRHTLRVVDAKTALLKAAGSAIEGALLPRADAVVTLTERAADALRPQLGDRVHVVAPGSDPARYEGPLEDPFPHVGRPRVVFVGRLAKAKGLDVLIEAVPRMRASAEIVIVGDGPERTRLEESARRVSPHVRFTGFVPPERVPAVLTHADVLVLPSLYEELGSILMEALQARLPVVASEVGGIPSAVTDGANGLLVPPGDPAALAVALDRVVANAALRRRLAEDAAARAPLYSWDAVAERMLAIYRGVATPGLALAPARGHGHLGEA